MSPAKIAVAGAAVALLVWLVGPVATSLASAFVGVEYTDHYGTQWFYWYAEQVLRGQASPSWTELQFHPYGKDLYTHTGANLLDAALAVPFRLLAGPVLGYNLFVAAGVACAALAFHRLARVFSDDFVATGLAALCFATSPFLLYELQEGRPTQGLLITLPLLLRHAWLAGQEPGWRHPLFGGLWLWLTGMTYWFYAFFAGLAILGLGLVRTVQAPQGDTVFARYAALGLLGAGLSLPLALPLVMATAGAGPEVPGLLDPSAWSWSRLTPVTEQGLAIGLFSWQPLHGVAGLYTSDGPLELFLPCHRLVSPAALLAVALWARDPGRLDRAGWAALVLPCALFAAGPLLLWGQTYVINPWWAGWTAAVPFLRRLWWPSRAFVIPVVGIGLCLVVVLDRLGTKSRRGQLAGAIALCGLWVHHLVRAELAPLQAWDATVPAGYRCLASGGQEALIELPYSWTQAHLYYQTHHGRPVLGGMLENNLVFTPHESVTLRSDNSFLHAILGVATLQTDDFGWTVQDRDALGAMGFGFVVLQKDAFHDPQAPGADKAATARRAHLRRTRDQLGQLLGQPVYDDARTTIFSPWGNPLPCDVQSLAPDLSPGPGETLRHTILSLPDEDAPVRPLFGG